MLEVGCTYIMDSYPNNFYKTGWLKKLIGVPFIVHHINTFSPRPVAQVEASPTNNIIWSGRIYCDFDTIRPWIDAQTSTAHRVAENPGAEWWDV